MEGPSLKLRMLLFFTGLLSTCNVYALRQYTFVIQETPYTRLCETKNILTVNGQFPGPTIYARYGETIVVNVVNKADHNITIHWHGVNQPRYPWSDGPEYITQCPVRPGQKFSQKVIFSEEEGTLWWHAHSDWSRATVHGAIVIYPRKGTNYPFPKPHAEKTVILGEWWKQDIFNVSAGISNGGDTISDAYMINGQPGDLIACSKSETFKMAIDYGKTYLLRLVNAAMQDLVFFGIAQHTLTVVGSDGSYVKQFKTDYITISPGQTMDVLLEANQPLGNYYMAVKAYSGGGSNFDNTTGTAILQYRDSSSKASSEAPLLPSLPAFNDTNASFTFTRKLRSLADKDHPVDVPLNIDTPLMFTEYVTFINGKGLSAAMNNISFATPTTTSILQAYYKNITGVYGADFPNVPPLMFDYTGDSLPTVYITPTKAAKVKVLEYNSTVEIVLQGANPLSAIEHPMHLHGHSFYVVGSGFGNFDKEKDPAGYNLVDPPLVNTIAVPRSGWTTVRFRANNPGVWFMHCHLERHATWGMEMAFITKNGHRPEETMLPPPQDMPSC